MMTSRPRECGGKEARHRFRVSDPGSMSESAVAATLCRRTPYAYTCKIITQQVGSAVHHHLPKSPTRTGHPVPRPGRTVLSMVESLLLPFKRLSIICS
jgi:hypothetical protein